MEKCENSFALAAVIRRQQSRERGPDLAALFCFQGPFRAPASAIERYYAFDAG
jgi:hypothetical protein